MTESMEGVWMGSWFVVKRGWAAKRRRFWVTRITVGASNDLQMERNLTGGLLVLYQGHSANLGPFRERFYPAHETRSERGDGRAREVWTPNGQRRKPGEPERMQVLKNMQMKCR